MWYSIPSVQYLRIVIHTIKVLMQILLNLILNLICDKEKKRSLQQFKKFKYKYMKRICDFIRKRKKFIKLWKSHILYIKHTRTYSSSMTNGHLFVRLMRWCGEVFHKLNCFKLSFEGVCITDLLCPQLHRALIFLSPEHLWQIRGVSVSGKNPFALWARDRYSTRHGV